LSRRVFAYVSVRASVCVSSAVCGDACLSLINQYNPGMATYYDTRASVHKHSLASDDDWLLHSLGWCMRSALRAFVAIVVLGVLVDFAFVFNDAYNGETMAKFQAKRVYDMYCNSAARADGISASVLQECSRQRAIMDRNAWSHAYHVSAEHIAEHIPGVRYCRSHPDMCALATLKFLDVMVIIFYWCPLIFGSGLLWYLWPAIVSMCLRRTMTASSSSHSNSTKSSSNSDFHNSSPEGIKAE